MLWGASCCNYNTSLLWVWWIWPRSTCYHIGPSSGIRKYRIFSVLWSQAGCHISRSSSVRCWRRSLSVIRGSGSHRHLLRCSPGFRRIRGQACGGQPHCRHTHRCSGARDLRGCQDNSASSFWWLWIVHSCSSRHRINSTNIELWCRCPNSNNSSCCSTFPKLWWCCSFSNNNNSCQHRLQSRRRSGGKYRLHPWRSGGLSHDLLHGRIQSWRRGDHNHSGVWRPEPGRDHSSLLRSRGPGIRSGGHWRTHSGGSTSSQHRADTRGADIQCRNILYRVDSGSRNNPG